MGVIDILRHYVQPATGCTEAAAVALAAAAARGATRVGIRRIDIAVDKYVLRNALAAVVPGAGGQPGIHLTAALGAIGGDPHLGLQVLDPITPSHVAAARSLVAAGAVALELDKTRSELYVQVTVHTAQGTGRAVIERSHANVTLVESNGQRLASPVASAAVADSKNAEAVRDWVRNLTVPALVACVREMDADAAEYIRRGIVMNERAAREGLSQAPGLGIGARLARSKERTTDDLALTAQTLTAAATDGRMAGLPVPVMASSGSGNQGIMVTLPALAVARGRAIDQEHLTRSVALGHLMLASCCEGLGPLTPLCGSALHAAAASSAAVSHLLGGDAAQIEQAATVVLGTQAGILCDGAKPSCALKAATGAQLAVQAALLAVGDLRVGHGNGLLGKGLPGMIADLVILAKEMEAASDRVLDIIVNDVGSAWPTQ